MSLPSWIPPLITFESYSGNWVNYENALYTIFEKDFIKSKPVLNGKPVFCIKDPMFQGKFFTFCHITTEGGPREEDRTPDIRRCERISWLKKIIENSTDSCIKTWENTRTNKKSRNKKRTNILFDENGETIHMVLSRNAKSYILITVYYVDRPHNRQKLINEYLSCTKSP